VRVRTAAEKPGKSVRSTEVKHSDHDALAVDALIYLLAVAFQSPKPTATVALARGLSPASGPQRVLAARKAGLLPETEPGKPAGA
jgi:hypothetical protein